MCAAKRCGSASYASSGSRSEEHTSELQSQSNLVCRLLLEKKKNQNKAYQPFFSYNKSDNRTLRTFYVCCGDSVHYSRHTRYWLSSTTPHLSLYRITCGHNT